MLKGQIVKRFLQIVIVLFGVSFLSFLLIYMAPGDPVRAMFAVSGNIPPEEILVEIREELGLNRPFLAQYGSWLMKCLQGDFGTSYTHGKPVAQLLRARVMPTLQLSLLSLLMMLIMAIPLGVLSAIYQNRPLDYIIRVGSFFGISMPNFWAGLLLLYIVSLKLGWLPVVSAEMGLKKMLLPAFTLAFAMAGKYARQIRASVLEELKQDYISGARARGIKESTILCKHVIPNSMLPLLTLLGLSLGSLLGGTAIVEVIFSFPALGSLAISAITSMDYPLIQGFVLWIAMIYMLVNLAVDFSYNYLDPRLRKGA
ncbi:peptide/nickel transport system permease protein [Alkalibaculum bacchi]|uniref:Nickel import system permease protein NikB n=1 Tax=Alkalibaculum bacchi TaxID=645887 RepID=A0A366HYI6_9FIRM|nr:nickel ABC transporter permease [Alkalibaculum bacchi]RBP57946.1 peptide/nickel transport system permease protein [Alkalibaculum bacchi]